MSIQALNWALAQDQILNSPAKFVLLILCNYADEKNYCYPSRETIAKKTGLSVPTVQRHLNWLVKHKYLSRKRRRSANRQESNLYKVESITLIPSSDFESINDDEKTHSESITLIPNTKDIREPKDKILDVFVHWKKELDHPRSQLDEKRKKLIERRLRDFTVSDLKTAIDGCKKSPWHSGQNPERKVYDSIGLIFRDSEHIEQFIGYVQNGKTEQPKIPGYTEEMRLEQEAFRKSLYAKR